MLCLDDGGPLGGFLMSVARGEPSRDDGGLRCGKGQPVLGKQGGGEQLLGAECDPVLHEVVVVTMVGVDVGGDGEVREHAVEVRAIGGWGLLSVGGVWLPCLALDGRRPHHDVARLPRGAWWVWRSS